MQRRVAAKRKQRGISSLYQLRIDLYSPVLEWMELKAGEPKRERDQIRHSVGTTSTTIRTTIGLITDWHICFEKHISYFSTRDNFINSLKQNSSDLVVVSQSVSGKGVTEYPKSGKSRPNRDNNCKTVFIQWCRERLHDDA